MNGKCNNVALVLIAEDKIKSEWMNMRSREKDDAGDIYEHFLVHTHMNFFHYIYSTR